MTFNEFKIWFDGFMAGLKPGDGMTPDKLAILKTQLDKVKVSSPAPATTIPTPSIEDIFRRRQKEIDEDKKKDYPWRDGPLWPYNEKYYLGDLPEDLLGKSVIVTLLN